jgi:hypothetical protein
MATNSTRAWARRDVLKVIGAVRDKTAVMKSRWHTPSTVFDYGQHDEHGNVPQRPRRWEEYPENTHESWEQLIADVDEMTDALTVLRRYAVDRRGDFGALTPDRRTAS